MKNLNTPPGRNIKVSVIMSVYNGQKYLKKAIDSILNQTFKDFEFIIVNDGSTDETQGIIDSYNDKRIVPLVNQENIGVYKSRNKGREIAQGEYIAVMDADDISLPERFELQVDFLNNHKDIALLGTTYYPIDDRGERLSTISVPFENEVIQEKLLEQNCFAHGSLMIRKKSLEKLKFYREEFKYAADYDLYLRIAEYYKVANLKEVLYKWRLHKGNITVAQGEEQEEYACLARQLAMERRGGNHFQPVELVTRGRKISSERTKRCILSKFYFGYGAAWLAQKKPQQARSQFFTSIQYNPWNIKTYIYFCLTFLPVGMVGILRKK